MYISLYIYNMNTYIYIYIYIYISDLGGGAIEYATVCLAY